MIITSWQDAYALLEHGNLVQDAEGDLFRVEHSRDSPMVLYFFGTEYDMTTLTAEGRTPHSYKFVRLPLTKMKVVPVDE